MAEIVGCINGAATVLILTLCLAAYGAVTFQGEGPQVRRLGHSPCGTSIGSPSAPVAWLLLPRH